MSQPSDVVVARPRVVDVAFALLLTAAVCAVAFTVLLPFGIGAAVERERAAALASGLSADSLRQQLAQFVVAEVIVATLFVAALVWTAFRLRAGRRRFRVVLIVLTVLSLVPANGQALLVAVLLIVGIVLVFQRSSSTYMTARDAQRDAARARRRI